VSNPLNPLYTAVAWLMTQIHTGLSTFLNPASGLVWVLTIMILVILMRLILVPLFIKQMHATRKMSALAPQLQELKKKYKNDKQTLQAETMRLYRENGANPLAGCLPLVGQMPLFFALFNVLRAMSTWNPHAHPYHPPPYGMSVSFVLSAQHARIFGATIADKFLFPVPGETLQARLVILFAVLISVFTTFLTIRQSTKRGMNPGMTPDNPMAASQKYMQYFVPLFALSGLYWQFGLVLYWVTTNIWTLGQQHVLFRRYPMPAMAGAPPVIKGKALPPDSQPPAKKPTGGTARPGTARPGGKPAAGGGRQPAANGSGMLRRLAKGRPEPEAPPPEPETKIVRQQRVRQSRSKRSGKR
jgi:YidC/Oxa1 family membrane protein insertase